MLNRIVSNRTDYLYKMDLSLNNLQRLIYHKTQPTNELKIHLKGQYHTLSNEKFQSSFDNG